MYFPTIGEKIITKSAGIVTTRPLKSSIFETFLKYSFIAGNAGTITIVPKTVIIAAEKSASLNKPFA